MSLLVSKRASQGWLRGLTGHSPLCLSLVSALLVGSACSGMAEERTGDENDGVSGSPSAGATDAPFPAPPGAIPGPGPSSGTTSPPVMPVPGSPSSTLVPAPTVTDSPAMSPSGSAGAPTGPQPTTPPLATDVPGVPAVPEPSPEPSTEPTVNPEPTSEPSMNPEPVAAPPPEPVVEPEPESIPGVCTDLGARDQGSVTFYTFDQGTVVPNCSYEVTGRNPDSVAHIATGNGQYFGAMNTSDYDGAAMCGACVEVTRDGNRTVTITIVDQCPVGTNPKCQAGHIDLSQAAFQQLGDLNEGYLGTGNGGMYGSISWRYVPCPLNENVSFRLKEPSRTDWNELLVQGHTYPIERVEINGQNATRKDYNYWEPPNGDMGPEPFDIRVIDVNGGVINASVARSDGDMVSNSQFMCQ